MKARGMSHQPDAQARAKLTKLKVRRLATEHAEDTEGNNKDANTANSIPSVSVISVAKCIRRKPPGCRRDSSEFGTGRLQRKDQPDAQARV
jgi:hypothetical protein